ncbi:hypothetical protein [Nonomuraea endophytica]|uniref:hypothetical protein n=1 Tax=Nonomuraea endophytica TaxID=714136 RepID=UPI0037C85176
MRVLALVLGEQAWEWGYCPLDVRLSATGSVLKDTVRCVAYLRMMGAVDDDFRVIFPAGLMDGHDSTRWWTPSACWASLPAAERDDIVAYRLGLEPHTLRSLVTAYDLAGAPGVHATRTRDPDDPQILRRTADAVSPLSPDPTVPSATGDSRVTGPAAGVEGRPGS